MLDWLENQRPAAKESRIPWRGLFGWAAFAGSVAVTATRSLKS
jgi:hypothetical protein